MQSNKQLSKPKQLQKPKQQGFSVKCSRVALILSIMVPVLICIILAIIMAVMASQKKNIKPLMTLFGFFAGLILISYILHKLIPQVMCFLFILQILLIIIIIITFSKK